MKPTVYLAGPIAGRTISEAREWRTKMIECLDTFGIRGIDPLAGAVFLDNHMVQTKGAPDLDPFTSAKGIMCQDFYYCTTSTMVLVNLLGATAVSIGSVMEAAWAYQRRTPLVVVAEPGNIHEHTMLRSAADYWVGSLPVALDVAMKVIGQ